MISRRGVFLRRCATAGRRLPSTRSPCSCRSARWQHTDPRSSVQRELEAYSRNWPVYALIAANVGVFGYFFATSNKSSSRRAFSEHFVLSNSRFERRPYVLLTSMFAHMDPFHLGMNMFTLWSFGSATLDMLGTRRFLALYFAGGLAGSLAHLAYSKYMPRYGRRWPAAYSVRRDDAAIGASAGVTALTMYTATRLFRSQTVLFVLPVPNVLFVPLFVGGSVYFCLEGNEGGRFAHAAHLGGAAVGIGIALTRALLRR
jgi:membrane associated rhomboid family serine protease